jgi:signal transduction histidine kinase
VLAVSTAAEQIIDNYIDNALTVSERGGSIIVRLSGDGRWTSLHVLDEGPGMSPEQTEQAFDRFWRGSADGAGNGLGLAIVAQLASASGATVRLTNRPDGGIDASARFADAP